MVAAIEHSAASMPTGCTPPGSATAASWPTPWPAYRIFAAIGPDSATELAPCPDPAPASVIAVHGTADKNIPYSRRRGGRDRRIDGPAVPAVSAAWRRTDGCAAPR